MVFGVSLRGAATLGLGALITIIDDEVMGYLIPQMNHSSNWLVQGFQTVVKWDTTILVFAVAVMLISNAIIRSDVTP